MANSATDTTAAAAASIDEVVSKPPAGVVLPPPAIRVIVEKTAGYVARSGATFEDRIRQKNANDAKFSFLNPADAYHGFYAWRLDEIRAGLGTDVSAGRLGEAAATKEPEKPKGPEPPPEFHFSARMPNISALDLDVVKLTALFVAKNGRSFATALSQRESTKSQFDFLRPQHSLYQFFSRLVDQYSSLLTGGDVEGGKPERERIKELELNIENKFHVLERARKRAEWIKFQESQKVKQEEQKEAENLAFAQIDWHDFVVVETVVFDESDNHKDLLPPTSLNDLQSASLEQKANASLAPSNMRLEEAMPTGDDFSGYQQPTYPQQPYIPTPSPVSLPQRPMEEQLQDRGQQFTPPNIATPPPMRIREGGAAPRGVGKRNVAMSKCPNCNQEVVMDELEKHMRICLLDPQWREQRAKAESRFATTNYATSEAANNLKRLASQRTDVFDPVSGRPISAEEQARMKRPATFTGDPNATGRPAQTLNIDEQIRSIHARHNQGGS